LFDSKQDISAAETLFLSFDMCKNLKDQETAMVQMNFVQAFSLEMDHDKTIYDLVNIKLFKNDKSLPSLT